VFKRLDYAKLGPVYCDEGGEAFWRHRRNACRRLGLAFASVLLNRLKPDGASLYVGAGVAEIPSLMMETLELNRKVVACNLRRAEVDILNAAWGGRIIFSASDAAKAEGRYDHLWIVSVLNDPERFPNLSALSYGRADPLTFDQKAFAKERRRVMALASACLGKLTGSALVTTSVEEVPWIEDWCRRRQVPYRIEWDEYPTAIVGDPMCFITVGRHGKGA
jgi:hypothetical protein